MPIDIYELANKFYPQVVPYVGIQWLAEDAGVDPSLIYMLASGHIKGIDLIDIAAICKSLEITIDDVIVPQTLPTLYPASRAYWHRCVYFFRRASNDIKIGKTLNLRLRWKQLEAKHGRLDLLLHVSGYSKLERRLHKYYASYRLDGEWFSPSDSLLGYIESTAKRVEYHYPTHEKLPRLNLWRWKEMGNQQHHEDVA